ncbi:MAG TPA: tripartite tricarboxylate transporter substrate-binding protein [Xanthobacteraceae bacterium]|nr:tripartite tricarboxylate transporter substrate-binding protein [Xanthobacteraceae bacterium]
MISARLACIALAAAILTCAGARAQEWPSHPLTLVVPFSAGGSSDAIARIVADGISNNLKQPVVVENVTGTGGMLGGARVARAAPDGYQLVIGNVGTFAQSQSLYRKPLYDAVADFAPVGLLTDEGLVLVTRKDLPADNLQQFIAFTKANQATMHFSSSGVGGSNHLACMLLNAAIGVDVTHVPYRNVVQGLQDVMAARMDYDCVSLPLALPQIAAKTVKPIAVLSEKRAATLPDVPTAAEQGLTGFAIASWYALFVPARTPPAIVRRLNAATVAALEVPALQQRLRQVGGDVIAPERRTPEYLRQFLAAEIKKWQGPIKASGLAF